MAGGPGRGSCGVALGILLAALTVPAAAQDTGGTGGIDVSALPLDLDRVQRGVQRSPEEFTQEDGRLNLDVFITVFGEAPAMNFLPGGDPNEPFFVGPPADGPPTHADLMRIRTPREFQSPVMDLGAAIQWLRDSLRSRGPQERR